jgi:2-methylisocitrate lyase-like PEP mutase family enzyme
MTAITTGQAQADKAARFLALHTSQRPLLMPNAWDAGSARLLEWLGFYAIATTSSGYAATLGRLDYNVSREEAIAHSRTIAEAVELPVSADLENLFSDEPAGVAESVRHAVGAGLAGCSIEDYTLKKDDPIYELGLARERVAAAAVAAHSGPVHLVLTARAENYLRGRPDLEDTIRRLQAYADAGADVLYAPGLASADDIRAVVESLDKPVNVLARPGAPSASELAALGVARISVGGSFAFNAYGALVEAATELRDQGTYGFSERTGVGAKAARDAFGASG